jgi:3-oxoacyl-[acyl-carrier-protein] synthase-3
MSSQVDWYDRNTCVLFGGGAAACVVTQGQALKYIQVDAPSGISLLHSSAGTGNSPFATPGAQQGYLQMQGQEVFKFAVNAIESGLTQALDTLHLTPDDIDYYILHQANKRIIDFARTKLGQPEEKFPTNIEQYGNLSSASLPLLLSEMLDDGRIKPGQTLFLSAFGAGLTTGSCVFVWE